jgi:hypothetical protein
LTKRGKNEVWRESEAGSRAEGPSGCEIYEMYVKTAERRTVLIHRCTQIDADDSLRERRRVERTAENGMHEKRGIIEETAGKIRILDRLGREEAAKKNGQTVHLLFPVRPRRFSVSSGQAYACDRLKNEGQRHREVSCGPQRSVRAEKTEIDPELDSG